MNEERFSLTDEELRTFERDGYIGPFDLFEPEEMERYRRAIIPQLLDTTHAIYHQGPTDPGPVIGSYDRHLDVDFLADLVGRPEVVDRVTSILGPDVLCWRTELFPKYPGSEGTDWHQAETFASVGLTKQDQIMWPEGSDRSGTITVWFALTEANVDNGCLQFIPGSHRVMHYDESKVLDYDPSRIGSVEKSGVKRGIYGLDFRQAQKDPAWAPDESEAVSMVMRQGQFIVFWSTLIHASHPHSGQTRKMRLGYAARYVPTCVRVYPTSSSIVQFGGEGSLERFGNVLVAGVDQFGFNRIATATLKGTPFRAPR